MTAYYRLDTPERQALFEVQFRNLYYRIRRLEDSLLCFFRRGDICGFVCGGASREGAPAICGVTFPRRSAERYERKLEKHFSDEKYRLPLPRPSFLLQIEVAFGGGLRETFAFRDTDDEAVIAFCSRVCERARYYFRRRFCREEGKDVRR